MSQLMALSVLCFADYDYRMMDALVGVMNQLKKLREEVSLGDNGRWGMVLQHRGQEGKSAQGKRRDGMGCKSQVGNQELWETLNKTTETMTWNAHQCYH